ncbi:hypothetical protein P692DRAFT_20882581 [Suillus brevipes Sb2]|nr:hypothetical protein P692DRAFT_20882581 [Suillus brevipes Sb2]
MGYDSDESDEENSDSHKGKKCRHSLSVIKPEVADKKIKAAAKVNLPAPLETDLLDSATASSADKGCTSALKATVGKPKSGGKAVKMHLSATKNGRNLCMLRWLKNTKTSSLAEEFCLYYGNLVFDLCEKYETEAMLLVANGSWTSGKSVCNGQLYK